ncbi:hypothetical protein DVH24_018713 [Malus domestica]|uniref:Uncharacterized protein n=1 Tax=Malus domestica TaxID=3750 RepID=A0A498HIN3_MALDO|nr:hypothetical protein DVH24_018713 [Malus domestica]
MKQYVEFAHVIGVAMPNNYPNAEWRSWKYVLDNVKKAVMDQLLVKMMNLMDEALKRGYKQWRYDVERNGGPAEQ